MKFKYSEELPISKHREQIVSAIADNQVVVVVGETGSGKSTQIPKMILEALAQMDKTDPEFSQFKIACTQPRRIAATSISSWIAKDLEVELGKEVGYKIRFDDDTTKGTLITICTDGILLQEMKSDNLLSNYDAVLVDEAHERNLNIDFLLGLLKDIQARRLERGLRPLKILVTSATVDSQKFVNFFAELNGEQEIPVINVSGRMYPVDIKFQPVDYHENLYKKIAKIIDGIVNSPKSGDVLIFMPGEAEIFSTIRAIDFLSLKNVKCLPLYSRLSMEDQQEIYDPYDGVKIVISTNIAETSLTVPGIKYVIDSGLARIKDFNFHTGIGSLEVKKVSKASSIQRTGRAGRIAPGVCIRLFAEEDFEEREAYTKPEIQRSDLASVVLHMVLIGIHDVYNFNFIDLPDMGAFRSAFKVLHELGALDSANNLTDLGRKMAHLPLEPRISSMLLAAERYNCVRQVAVIASSLSVKDPFLRPNGEEDEADSAKRYFQKLAGRSGRKYKMIKVRKGRRMIRKKVPIKLDQGSSYVSDLVVFLHVWNKIKSIEGREAREQFCEQNYLNFQVIDEIEQIYHQLLDTLHTFAGQEFEKYLHGSNGDLQMDLTNVEGIVKSISAGLIQNICESANGQSYRSGRANDILIHPGSALFGLNPKWFVSAEIVETTRLYARNNTVVDPEWFEEVAPYLCTYKYGDLYYDRKLKKTVREEDVFFKGHRIIRKRITTVRQKDRYQAFEFFVREALVKKGLIGKYDFVAKNERVRKELEEYAAMTKNEKYLIDYQKLFDWYVVRCTEHKIYPVSETELDSLLAIKGKDALLLKLDDFIAEEDRNSLREDFPEEIYFNGNPYKVRYFAGHYKYPDGPAICLRVQDLLDLGNRKITNIIKDNPKFKPFIVVCNGEEFINPIVMGADLDEIRSEYDLMQLKKQWKVARREVEVKGLRGNDVLEYFQQVLEEVEIGNSIFASGSNLAVMGYKGLRKEGKKYLLTLFDKKEKAVVGTLEVLKDLFANIVKQNLYFTDTEKKRMISKLEKCFPYDNAVRKLEELVWQGLGIDRELISQSKLNSQNAVKEFLESKKNHLEEVKQKILNQFLD